MFPETAKIYDEFLAAFGPDTKLVCAIEGDNRIGREEDIKVMQRWIRESKGESNA
jgi:hypothetical protein